MLHNVSVRVMLLVQYRKQYDFTYRMLNNKGGLIFENNSVVEEAKENHLHDR